MQKKNNNLLNFSALVVNIYNKNGTELLQTIPKESVALKVEEECTEIAETTPEGIEIVFSPRFRKLNFNPPEDCDIIVSITVANHLKKERNNYPLIGHIYTVDYTPEGIVRNNEGGIIGTRRLIKHF